MLLTLSTAVPCLTGTSLCFSKLGELSWNLSKADQPRAAITMVMKQSRVCFVSPLTPHPTAGVCVCFAAAVKRKAQAKCIVNEDTVLKPPRCAAVSCNVSRQDTGGMWRQQSRDTDCSRGEGEQKVQVNNISWSD